MHILQNHLAGLEVSGSSKFQVNCSYSLGAVVLKIFFYHSALSGLKIQDGHSKIKRHLAWPQFVPTLKFIVVKLFELSSRNQIWPLWPQWPSNYWSQEAITTYHGRRFENKSNVWHSMIRPSDRKWKQKQIWCLWPWKPWSWPQNE